MVLQPFAGDKRDGICRRTPRFASRSSTGQRTARRQRGWHLAAAPPPVPSVVPQGRAVAQGVVQPGFPGLHEGDVEVLRESTDDRVPLGPQARLAVGHLGLRPVRSRPETDGDPAGRDARRQLDHLRESAFRLMAGDIPDRVRGRPGGDEGTVPLGHPRGGDHEQRVPARVQSASRTGQRSGKTASGGPASRWMHVWLARFGGRVFIPRQLSSRRRSWRASRASLRSLARR